VDVGFRGESKGERGGKKEPGWMLRGIGADKDLNCMEKEI
jgi:hypothetical protein